MINELIKLIQSQEEELKKLLELLETQYRMIMGKDVFGLEGLVDKINDSSKKVAEAELMRRKLMGKHKLSEFVSMSDNEEIKYTYNNIKIILDKLKMTKETNEILLKQKINFNTKMLAILNPSREIKTYNSYGNISR